MVLHHITYIYVCLHIFTDVTPYNEMNSSASERILILQTILKIITSSKKYIQYLFTTFRP